MKKYGLIGHPLGHSFSAGYFSKKFAEEGIAAVYRNYPMEDLSGFRNLVRSEPSLCGLNVTVPHKRAIIPYLDHLEENAAAIGAVNTILFSRTGSKPVLTGYNTDISGFRRSLCEHLRTGHRSALVLGTGGASAAVVHVLEGLGISYRMVSRRGGAGGRLGYSDLTVSLMREFQIIVNTTPLGMHPDVESCPDIPYQALHSGHLLFDLVYNPSKTRFLQQGERRGATAVNGYDMLVYQAEASWEIWNRDDRERHPE